MIRQVRRIISNLPLQLAVLAAGCHGDKYLDEFSVEVANSGREFFAPEQVTAGNEDNFAPNLSPNGEFVIYTSDRKGNKDIWEKRTQGGFARALTLHAADDFSPVLSPDGTKIAFISRRDDAAGDVHILKLGTMSLGGIFGGKEGDIAAIGSPQTEDTNPSWFPDGKRLVFAARHPGERVPALMQAAIEDLKPEPIGDLHGDQPNVAPDGTMIAFVRSGALFVYDLKTEKTEQLTDGGRIQDGQPRFSPDGKDILFIRYMDDSNDDGKLDGDDRPTIWRLNLVRQRQAKVKENYGLVPLTAATNAYFSPQIRGPYLYAAIQTNEGLNIFRLPLEGQLSTKAMQALTDLGAVEHLVESRQDYFEKVLIIRRAVVAFLDRGEDRLAGEAALMEMDAAVFANRRMEAQVAADKIKGNFPKRRELAALADLNLIDLDLAPLEYPRFRGDLSVDQKARLSQLLTRVEQAGDLKGMDSAESRRVNGRAKLIKAKILAASRRFFDANQLLANLQQDYAHDGPDRAVASVAALYAAILVPATSDVNSALVALRAVAKTYPERRDLVQRAARAAIDLVEANAEKKAGPIEGLVALRLAAKGVPIMPALAHRRIADLYLEQGKDAVAANELRQIVDLYPDAVDLRLDAAESLTALEEKAGRFDQADAMLKKLVAQLATAKTEWRERATAILKEFLLHRGEASMRAKDYPGARRQYEAVIAIDSLNIPAHRGKIDAAFRQGDLQTLLDDYRAKLDADPGRAELMYIYAYAKSFDIDTAQSLPARLSAIDAAIAAIEEVRQENSQLLQVHQTLGWLYMQKNFTTHEYERTGSWWAGAKKRLGLVRDFFGAGAPDWRELAIDAYQNAYFLSRPGSTDRAGMAQNLGQAYYALKNHQKSLAYFLQRIKLLDVIPMRDARAEGVLFDRAGRSAFQTDELALAETLQRNALSVWETVSDDDRIAYAIDALALTVRERQHYKEAIVLYERLERMQIRLGAKVNRVGTLSNLGYCAFMNGDNAKALGWFDLAEAALTGQSDAVVDEGSGEEVATAPPKKSDAIKVDLGGQGSAAQGFDVFGRHNLLLSFRAQIYEKMNRLDLAIGSYERKLQLLHDEDKNGRNLKEEIAIATNVLGDLRLKAGYHRQARESFQEASVIAKASRPAEQKFKAPGELLNEVNAARVQLRLASLGLLDSKEVTQSAKDLSSDAEDLRPSYNDGAKIQGKNLAALLSLAAQLRLTQGTGEDKDALRRQLADAVAIARQSDLPRSSSTGPLLAVNQIGGSKAADGSAESLASMMAELSQSAKASPALEWKVLAAAGDFDKAFEALDRLIAGGGSLPAPPDRLLARRLFEQVVAATQKNSALDGALPLLRRYMLIRLTELVQRQGLEARRLNKLLGLKEDPQIFAALGMDDAALIVHRTLAGRIMAFMVRKGAMANVSFDVAPQALQDPMAFTQLFQDSSMRAALPGAGGRLFIVPSPELYALPWEKLAVGGEPLGQRLVLAFLPAIDLLPELNTMRRLPKSEVAYIGQPSAAGGRVLPDYFRVLSVRAFPETPAAGKAETQEKSVSLSKTKDFLQELGGSHIIHADAPLRLNDVEPGRSTLRINSGNAGATERLADLPLRDLATARLPLTTALIFNNVMRDNGELRASGEGSDGWAFLTVAAAAAGVPTVLMIERPLPAGGGEDLAAGVDDGKGGNDENAGSGASLPPPPPLLPPLSGAEADWSAFYRNLSEHGVGSAARGTVLAARLLGHPGIRDDEELKFAKEGLGKAVEQAEDARADQDFDAAAVAYQKAWAFAARLGKPEAEYLTGIVQSLFQKRDFSGALRFKLKHAALLRPCKIDKNSPATGSDGHGAAQDSCPASRQKADPVDYGNALVDAAVLAVKAENTTQAESLLSEAEVIFTAEDEPAQLGKIWHYRAISREVQRKYDETLSCYAKAHEYYRKSKPEDAAGILLAIGNIHRNNFSNYPEALGYYDQAAAAFKKLGKVDLYLSVLIDQANTLMAVGDLEGAIRVLERQAIPALDGKKQQNLWLRANQTLANCYYQAGLFSEASDLNDKVLTLSATLPAKAARADRQIEAIGLRAMIQAKQGRYKQAFEDFRQAIKIAYEFSRSNQISLLYNNYGFWAREYGAIDQSMEFFAIARQIDEDLKSRSAMAYDDRNMGLSSIVKGDYNRARSLLTRSLKESEALYLAYNAAYCHFGLGDLAMREGQWAEAQKQFQQSLSMASKSYMLDFIWRAQAGVGGAELKQDKLDAALESYEKSVRFLEGLRAGLKSGPSRNRFYSDAGTQEVYEAYAAVLMRLGKVERAWEASEKSRARAFMDSMGTQKLHLPNDTSNQLLAEEKERKAILQGLERQLVAAGSKAKEQAVALAALAQARGDYAATLAKMRNTEPQLPDFVHPEAITRSEVAGRLGAAAALISYQITPDRLLIWLLKDGAINGWQVPVTAENLTARVRDFRDLMQNFSSTTYLGRELSELLLAPAREQLAGVQRLLVVPHGVLHFLPFAALPWPNAENGVDLPQSGKSYMIDHVSLSYLDSAAMLRAGGGKSAEAQLASNQTKVFAVANPQLGEAWADLPFAGKEAEVIGRYFPNLAMVEGREATKSALAAGVSGADILHLATHGEFKAQAPIESRLLLAANAPMSSVDGLNVSEIFGLSTKANLVVLSACDSGLGKLSSGDEVIGMDRAFFYAGAKTVVSSLWRVSDVASAVTMKRFYRYLAAGKPKAEALRAAQQVTRKYFDHPAYWSAFRLLGDDR